MRTHRAQISRYKNNDAQRTKRMRDELIRSKKKRTTNIYTLFNALCFCLTAQKPSVNHASKTRILWFVFSKAEFLLNFHHIDDFFFSLRNWRRSSHCSYYIVVEIRMLIFFLFSESRAAVKLERVKDIKKEKKLLNCWTNWCDEIINISYNSNVTIEINRYYISIERYKVKAHTCKRVEMAEKVNERIFGYEGREKERRSKCYCVRREFAIITTTITKQYNAYMFTCVKCAE